MALRVLVTITACLLLATTAASATQLVITERDSGKSFTVRRGGTATLRLSGRYRWVGPKVKGRAVRLSPVDYFADPGFREWQVDAVARGRAKITAVGYDPIGDRVPRRFRVLIVVR
jgi:predicted secreted protein